MRQLAAARGADDADRRQIDEGAGAGAHFAVDDLAQPGKGRRAGAAGVAQGGDPARPAETVGVAGHVVRVDEDVGVDVDQARRHQPALGADRAPRLRGRQRRRHRDDLAAGDADIHDAAQPGRRIEHLAPGQQKIVFHRRPSGSYGMRHGPPSGQQWQPQAGANARRPHDIPNNALDFRVRFLSRSLVAGLSFSRFPRPRTLCCFCCFLQRKFS